MFELAYNVNGEPFEVPPTMAAWRVRKLKPKGAPEVVYGRDGLPLFLPMDADIEDLRREARGDGRYRLDPVDEHNRPVPSAPSGYVCVHPIERAPEPCFRPAATEPKPGGGAQQGAERDDSDEDDEIGSDEFDDEIESDQVAVEVAPQPEYSWARVAQTFADHVTPHVGPLLEGLP